MDWEGDDDTAVSTTIQVGLAGLDIPPSIRPGLGPDLRPRRQLDPFNYVHVTIPLKTTLHAYLITVCR